MAKVQSASLHFFLGSEEDDDDDDDDDNDVCLFSPLRLDSNQFRQNIDVKSLHHRREINKKTRSGDKKLRKQLMLAKKVCKPKIISFSHK